MKSLILLLILLVFTTTLRSGEKLKVSLPVKGMHCQSCISMVKKAIRKVEGVENVSVNLDSGRVDIEYKTIEALPAAIRAITRMGYKVLTDSLPTVEHQLNH